MRQATWRAAHRAVQFNVCPAGKFFNEIALQEMNRRIGLDPKGETVAVRVGGRLVLRGRIVYGRFEDDWENQSPRSRL